jgi:hypothetical protein
LKTLLPVQGVVMPFGDVWVGTGAQHMPVTLPEGQQQLILLVVPVALALLLWAAAYARLTEKQI